MDDILPLSGKAGVVTGSGTGIGRAIARRLSDLGANVTLNYFTSEKGARETRDYISSKGRRAITFQCDVSKEDQVKEMINKTYSEFGRIDFLVNNSTGSHVKSDNSVDIGNLEDWNQEIGVDLTGAFLCTRYVSPLMINAKQGKIINISSICAITGDCGPAYCAAKAGLLGLTRSCAVSLAPFVQVNAILPGFVSSQPHDPDAVAKITPGRKMGKPEDVAELVGDIISMRGTFLTGSCITIDGAVTEGIIGLSMGWINQRI